MAKITIPNNIETIDNNDNIVVLNSNSETKKIAWDDFKEAVGVKEGGLTPVFELEEDGDLYVQYQDEELVPEIDYITPIQLSGELSQLNGQLSNHAAITASEDELGHVKPIDAEADMVNPVGVDEDGKLWTAPNSININTTTSFNGILKGDGENIGQAVAGTDYAKAPITRAAVLHLEDWGEPSEISGTYVQSIDVPSVRAASIVIVSANEWDIDMYVDAGVRCTMQGWDTLTFVAKNLPADDLNVNVLIF